MSDLEFWHAPLPHNDDEPSKGCLIGCLLGAVLWGVLAALGAMVL